MSSDRSASRLFRIDAILLVLLVAAGGGVFVYWKRESDRAGCILNLRNVQQAARSHQGMNNLDQGDPLAPPDLIGPRLYLSAPPACPSGGTYTWSTTHPPIGTLVIECSHPGHRPTSTAGW